MNLRRWFCLLLLLLFPAGVFAQETPAGYVELHRLRITNREEGAIQVSTDAGVTWRLIGRVLYPATTVAEGYIAAEYAPQGTVAAIAVHGLRIRASRPGLASHAPLILSVDPKEYANKIPNKGYGGHRPGSAGIFTDIPAGTSIFRELAPLVGNPVYLESKETKRLYPLPEVFKPEGKGEVFVIPVLAPKDSLVSVTFENKRGGMVTGTFASGEVRQITQVVEPVKGVGRFDGTAYTGVGRLNTAHTGVVTVCTAPIDGALAEGEGEERRGGFQISPAWHNNRTEEAGAPMVMTLGAPGPRTKDLEGVAPLFKDNVSLASGLDPTKEGIVDMSVDGGAWEPLLTLIGLHLDAFTTAGLNRYYSSTGSKRRVTQGVTAFRLRLPELKPERWTTLAQSAVESYNKTRLAAAQRGDLPIVKGLLTLNANPTNAANVAFVRILVEGELRGFTNAAPFNLTWDTRREADGEYLVEAEAVDTTGNVLARTKRRVYVRNTPETTTASAQ